MVNKSKVRQSALNLIYAVEENGGSVEQLDLNLFWEIEQEKDTDDYRKTLAKALLHTARASADSARLLETRADEAIAAFCDSLPAAKLSEDVARLQKRSAEFESALAALKYCLKDKRQDTTHQLWLCCKDVIALAQIIGALAENLLPLFADFPEFRAVLQKLEAAITRRRKQMSTCAIMSNPKDLLGQPEYLNLVRCAEVLEQLQPEAEKLALNVLSKKVELDAILIPLLHNYSIERMDVIDKAILYLALYELKFNKLDTPIVVSEATALANDYSGGKSAPFIHGIISAAAKGN